MEQLQIGAVVGGGWVSVGIGTGVKVGGMKVSVGVKVMVGVIVWVAVISGVKVLVTLGRKVWVKVGELAGGRGVQVARSVGSGARVGTSRRMAVGADWQAAMNRVNDRRTILYVLCFFILDPFYLQKGAQALISIIFSAYHFR